MTVRKFLLSLTVVISMMVWLFSTQTISVLAQDESAKEKDIYDSLQESINENWENGWESMETEDEIKIEGPITERIIRGIANMFYKHLVEIKAWSLAIGLISILCGTFIAVTAKLNKKLKRFAIVALIITIPGLLTGFVFGITKLVSIFV